MLLLTKLRRLYHTIRPLRVEQIVYRIYYKLFPISKITYDPGVCNVAAWVWNGPEVIQPSFLGGNAVSFLNLAGLIDSKQDWNNPEYEKLWLYNLHYFDDLNALNNPTRLETQLNLVERWISENPLFSGNGWEPYTISLRLVNWIKWYNRAELNRPNIIHSIDLQSKALTKQLEYHILGNHLFANAKALVFVGCFLQSAQAKRYLQAGLKILEKEIPEQFLRDGGHFELTPMYHCILLWDLLDLINLAEITKRKELITVLPKWRAIALKALQWLTVMQHPDGEVSFFNDSTFGIATKPAHLFDYATSLNLILAALPMPELVTLPESGYSRVSMPEHSLIFDHAAIGPDYLPGHAHADTLSLEWSVGKERVLVNSGTSIYGVSKERVRQRQTAAHNTVVVDDSDSSEVWSGFRVARRAYAKLIEAKSLKNRVSLTASHNGYLRLKGKIIHQRKIESTVRGVDIYDRLIGTFTQASVHWHLHPSIKVEQVSALEIKLTLLSEKCISLKCNVSLTIVPSSWHPGFGETINSTKIIANFASDEVQISIRIN